MDGPREGGRITEKVEINMFRRDLNNADLHADVSVPCSLINKTLLLFTILINKITTDIFPSNLIVTGLMAGDKKKTNKP